MTQQRVCVKCSRVSAQIFSRCYHILHEECFKALENYNKKCPYCKVSFSEYFEVEELIVKIKSSDLPVSDIAELCYCLQMFTSGGGSIYDFDKFKFYDKSVLETLLKFGFDINSRYFKIRKSFYDDLCKLDLLINYGLDLKRRAESGLAYTCESSNYEAFERLIQAGVKINYHTLEGVIKGRNFELLERIFKLGVDIEAVGCSRRRPIHFAAMHGSIKMLQILIDNGADFNAVDTKGDTIAHYACEWNIEPLIVEYLVESEFDFTIRNYKQQTPLMLTRSKYIVKYLIQKKVDINVHDADGNTPLHLAVMNCRIWIIDTLIGAGADINAKNKDGKTPLHVLDPKLVGNFVVFSLLEHGANVTILDNAGKSAFYYLHDKIDGVLKMKFINAGADLTIKNSR